MELGFDLGREYWKSVEKDEGKKSMVGTERYQEQGRGLTGEGSVCLKMVHQGQSRSNRRAKEATV